MTVEVTPLENVFVLDHGFVRLDGAEASDLSVVNAARVSFGKRKTALDDKDIGLIKFLMRNRHATPFEHNMMRFHVKCPIAVAREWFRHRWACLSGDTQITYLDPRGISHKRAIKEIFQLKHGGVVDIPHRIKNGYSRIGTPVTRERRLRNPWRTRILPNCQNRLLRVLEPNSGFYVSELMEDVWEAGCKDLFKIATEDGATIQASAEHKFYTRDGWASVAELGRGFELARSRLVAGNERPYPPSLRKGIGVWTEMMRPRLIAETDVCYICGQRFSSDDLTLDHEVPVVLDLTRALDVTNLRPACRPCHRKKTDGEQSLRSVNQVLGLKWVRLTRKPERIGHEMTYDISTVGPNHNFVANGFVVHNSYNEYSLRYSEAIKECYIPTYEAVRSQVGKPGNYHFETLDPDTASEVRELMSDLYEDAFDTYQRLLSMGVAKELARFVLPFGLYTEFFFTANARALMNFLSLRNEEHAMYEIREYAAAVERFFEQLMPITHAAFVEFGRQAP